MVLTLFSVWGALTALAYAALLAWNTRLYLSPKPASWPVLLHVARTAVVVAALGALVLAGSKPLVAGLVGFACAHAAAVIAMRSRA